MGALVVSWVTKDGQTEALDARKYCADCTPDAETLAYLRIVLGTELGSDVEPVVSLVAA